MARVYIMDRGTAFKVGYSSDVDARRILVERECGAPVSTVWVSEDVKNAEPFERDAHASLWARGYHVEREWFSADLETCVDAVTRSLAGELTDIDRVLGNSKVGFSWEARLTRISLDVTPELRAAIDEIRVASRPILNISEAVRLAILNEQGRVCERLISDIMCCDVAEMVQTN